MPCTEELGSDRRGIWVLRRPVTLSSLGRRRAGPWHGRGMELVGLPQLWQVSKDQGHWLGRQNFCLSSQARDDASHLLSPEPAFGDHLRLRQCPQLQPLPLPYCAQWLRGRAGQLPEGPQL